MGLTVSNPRDLAGGLVCIAIGTLFLLLGQELEIGSLFRMGPGFFPAVLAWMLIVLGVAVAVTGLRTRGEWPRGFAWRGVVLVVGTTVLFGLCLRGLGFVPSVALVVFLVAWASVEMRLLTAAVLALVLTAFCTLVFIEGLGLPLRLFGPWLEFGGGAPPPPPPS